MKRILKIASLFLLAAALVETDARGDGVAQILTAKSIPPATVQVIDPESGSSSGGGTTDVKVAVGDVILFRFKYFPVPDKIVRGLQGYLTEYIPANTQVVGFRLIDENGLTIPPRFPGISVDGCARPCNGFNSVPGFTTTDRNLDDGSISQVYADTGVWYTTDARLTRNPGTSFLALNNGINMSPEPRDASLIAGILSTAAPFFAHNTWDWAQVRGFGTNTAYAENAGRGNTPFGYGSPVAGPQTFYQYEATEVTGLPMAEEPIRFRDVVGPWQRVKYPGSQIGSGMAITGGAETLKRMNVDTALGHDLTPLNPLPTTTKAVRAAMGEVRVGEPGFAEVALKVTGTPIDPVQARDVDCAEVHGGDTSAASDTVRAKDNMWPLYVPSPNCVFLNLLFDLDVDDKLALTGDTLVYTLHGKNLSINPQTNAVVRMRYDSTRVSFVSATGGPTNLGTCDDGSGLACLRWPAMSLLPSDEYTFTANFTVGGGGHVTNVMVANYRSDQLPSPGFTTQAISMVKQVAVLNATLTSTTPSATAGGTADLTGTLSNTGSGDSDLDEFNIWLPTGWSVSGAVTVDGITLGCSGTNPRNCTLGGSLMPGASQPIAFSVNVPGGTTQGLYRIDLQIWGSQSAFGGSYETYFNDVATVSVGAVRSVPPVLNCPIINGDTTISGTTVEATGTTIRLYFNLLQRATGTSTAGGTWSITGFVATFGSLFGGLEVRATAQAPGENESELSAPCVVTNVPACSDFLDNDGDGLVDFPADPGCDSQTDNTEADPVYQCSDTIDNDLDGPIDFPSDLSCSSPEDPTESGNPACSDTVDNDGDGLIDFPGDPGCSGASDPNEISFDVCADGLDNDADGLIDFGSDGGCHSLNDDDERDFTAPDVKARLLIAFDTSGSMNWNTCNSTFTGGDGTLECPGSDVTCAVCGPAGSGCGNATADDSRLFKVKEGLSDVIAAFGEVDYSLMRFHQRALPFVCPTSNASQQSGGWQGGGAAPCPGFASGDLLVGFSPDNAYDMLEWMDERDGYGGTPPAGLDVELRGSGTTPLAGILQSALTYMDDVRAGDTASTCRPYRVVLVTDGAESCGGDAPGAAAALLAVGIPVYVIGFATSDPSIQANLNAIAMAGGTGLAIVVDDSTELSLAMSSIITDTILIERCNGVDDDCDALIDEDFPDLGQTCNNGQQGECFRTGTRICAASQLGTTCDAPTVTPGIEICNGLDDDCDGLIDDGIICTPCTPTTEVCNGIDDDCDSLIDEPPLPGVGEPCGTDIGECEAGTLSCTMGGVECVGETGPAMEICNNLDDDCDTVIDQFVVECYTFPTGCTIGVGCQGECRTGLDTCSAGSQSGCVGQVGPIPELCNGLDDDCDGLVDEDFANLGEDCDNGLIGDCRTTGVVACLPDGSDAYCTAPPVGVGTEICNGEDDDCDGLVDEDPLGPPIGDPCGGGASCTPGVLDCVMGEIVCVGAGGGSPEVCNGLDDDCDSFIDEPVLPGVGLPCTDVGFEMIGETGECDFGDTICFGGEIICEGYEGPEPEVCNGLDDDCDGDADDFAACPVAVDLCLEGDCLAPCGPGEFPCPFGFLCKTFPEGDFCSPDPCRDVTCDDGFRCDTDTGVCDDLCDPNPCQPGEVCTGLPNDRECQDCFDFGCEPDQVCVSQGGVGTCMDNPCYDVTCNEGFFCQDGSCVPTTCTPACSGDQVCQNGECVTPCVDACADVRCFTAGTVCHPATGECIADPCLTTMCNMGQTCSVTCDGTSTCQAPPPPEVEEITAAGGGGCTCEATTRTGRPNLLALLAFLGVTLLVRKRRKSQ